MAQDNLRRGDSAPGELSEIVIVDTFTRLIFGDDASVLSRAELGVIEALRRVEPDVAGDDLQAMGEFLRSLGVGEMIALVGRVQQCAAPFPSPPSSGRRAQHLRAC
ncbi:hypothetical protein [Parahaliea aestuarii]|uniref:Uncharacterized protein n=1 Tax=Parahaliea aestuarii TaxID=1852021 RepID=A0A5C8ZN01_9GAMM|nr:hypothetical protein [Parahaliea aestuarii]TXS89134.1 hypothetical protein FVW59_18600 [Parahaliea aestuarii]